jgi:SDR family mycofactocin-dependent oxidoreductase
MARLSGKVAFITGAARGQGRSHAIRFAQEGARVIALDICGQIDSVGYAMSTPDDLEHTVKLVEEAGGQIHAAQGDVRDVARVNEVLAAGVEKFGRLDCVLANAGIMPLVGQQAFGQSAWRDAIDVMLTGVYNTVEAGLQVLREQGQGGSIVITSSAAGLRGNIRSPKGMSAGYAGYHAAKFGVVGLTKLYANAYGEESIRVNSVHPTGVNTPMAVNPEFTEFVTEYPEILEAMSNALPVPMVEPVDISNAIVFLCSEEGRYITGVQLPVDAGSTNR